MIVTFRIKIPKETEIEVLFLFDRLYDFFFFYHYQVHSEAAVQK